MPSTPRRDLYWTVAVLLGAGLPASGSAQLTEVGAHLLDECAAPGDCLSGDGFGGALAAGDFNGDGFADLAVGVAGETVGGDQNAGSVHVYYGSAAGLTATGEQLFDQSLADIPGAPEPGDFFGGSLAVGDFDFDGFDDLVIAVDGEDLGTEVNNGTFTVLFGSASGLTTTGALSFSQDNLPPGSSESSEDSDSFASALAVSSDNDLAVGVPNEDFVLANETNAGLVNVLTSSPGDPFDGATEREQNDFLDECGAADGNELNDFWGGTMVWGDFDGVSPSLAVAGRSEDFGGLDGAGRVTVMFGSTTRCLDQNSSGVFEVAEAEDVFGQALATGDFDGDGFEDLAVSAPGEDLDSTADGRAGLVHVFFGTASGLSTAGDVAFAQDNFPLGQEAGDFNDHFGEALVAGDFDGDGFEDLAIGVPDEDLADADDSGSVHVRYGDLAGFDTDRDQTFHSSFPAAMPDTPETGDALGSALAAGDFDGSGTLDLAIGAPGEDIGASSSAGRVTVLYGLDGATGAFGEVHLSESATVSEAPGNRLVFVFRTGGARLAASVDHSRTGGTATPGADFNYSGGTESWAVGEIGFELFTVQILGDTLDENDETVRIGLSHPSANLALGSPSTMTLTIEDDDEGGILNFQSATFTVAEGVAQQLVAVVRTDGEASGVTILYDTDDDTATAGADYTAVSGLLTFDAGQHSATFPVAIIDDTADEPLETVELQIFSPQGGGILGTLFTATLRIQDNDPAGQIFLDGFESGGTSNWSAAAP